MLEGQLERARKDLVALKRKLDSRPAAALHPALLRAAQACSPDSSCHRLQKLSTFPWT